MNNTNPFVPQGSLLDQKNKKRARVKIAVYTIFAINLLVVTPLLIQGCSKKNADDTAANTPPPDTNSAPVATDTNTAPQLTPPPTNAPVATAPAPVVQPPIQPVAPPPPPAPTATEYVIAKGDTYYSIAKKYGLKMSDIKKANPEVNPAKLKVGQKIQVPAAGGTAGGTGGVGAAADAGSDVYVVKAGDTLGKIAKANGTTVKTLKAENNLKTDHIKVGDKLKLPVKAAAPVSTTVSTPAPDASAAAAPATPSQPAPVASTNPGTTAAH